ncbi:MAG TPA: PEP-utilizing enzyme [Pseudonocardia sp.]|nr:PEP-utilizing enzyme [Pseudonocardia sp.]
MSSAGRDPLMPSERADHHWTTANLGEAAPGVLTPLGLGLWGETAERATRQAMYTLGVMGRDELEPPADVTDWILRPFHGRLAMRLEFMAMVGDRMPMVTGRDAIRGMFGEAPATMEFAPTRARYGAIATKFPRAFVTLPTRMRAAAAEQDTWWRASVAQVHDLDLAAARRLFAEAQLRFAKTSSLQLVSTMSTIQPLYDALGALVVRAGVGEVALLSGVGGAETHVVNDIWRASRSRITVEDVVRAHGFHGPLEGEISGRVWREDDSPLRTLVKRYADRDEVDDPHRREAARSHELARMQREVVAALPAPARPAARLVLRLAADRIPLRGVAKRSFLQAIDVARAAARRSGELLVADGVMDDPEDVFMLTGRELALALPGDVQAIVAERRTYRAAHQAVRLADSQWRGLPTLVSVERSEPAAGSEPGSDSEAGSGTGANDALTGLGVSAGVVEGTVRVVTDPSFADVEPDEILVAPTTDPSWSSIMFISSALVVDIGGALSHAAVVAREFGIPCVVGVRDGTRVLRTGDRVRVDGGAGTVHILERAAPEVAAQ